MRNDLSAKIYEILGTSIWSVFTTAKEKVSRRNGCEKQGQDKIVCVREQQEKRCCLAWSVHQTTNQILQDLARPSEFPNPPGNCSGSGSGFVFAGSGITDAELFRCVP